MSFIHMHQLISFIYEINCLDVYTVVKAMYKMQMEEYNQQSSDRDEEKGKKKSMKIF